MPVMMGLIVLLQAAMVANAAAAALRGDSVYGRSSRRHSFTTRERPARSLWAVDGCTVSDSVTIMDNEGLATLSAQMSACVDGWAIEGGLKIANTNDVADLEALANLVAILGSDTGGYSLRLSNNAALASIHGLHEVVGALPGAVMITGNPLLTSLSGFEGVTAVEGSSGGGRSLRITGNGMMCLSADDRERLTACSTGNCFASQCTAGACDGAALSITGGGSVSVQAAQTPDEECRACLGGAFSVANPTCPPTAAPTSPTESPTQAPSTSPSV